MKEVDRVARERATRLLELAREALPTEPDRARRYAKLAAKLSQRHRLALPARSVCRSCGQVWIVGRTVRVRLSREGRKTALYTCLSCNYHRRYPYRTVR